MKIHGIEVTNNMDIEDIVAILNALNVATELTSKKLDSSLDNYKKVSDISTDIADKNQGVLESINTLQIQAENSVNDAIEKAENLKTQMAKYYSAEYYKTKENLDSVLTSVKYELQKAKTTFNLTIQDATKDIDIDTSKIEKSISKQIDAKLAEIDLSEIKKTQLALDETFNKFKLAKKAIVQINANLGTSVNELDKKTISINTSIKKINKMQLHLSKIVIIALLTFGISLGSLLATAPFIKEWFSSINLVNYGFFGVLLSATIFVHWVIADKQDF